MVISEFVSCCGTTLSFCDRIRGVRKCTGTRCHAAVGFLAAEKDNNSFCQWGRKGAKSSETGRARWHSGMLLVCHSSGINTMDMCIAHTVFLVVERGDPYPTPTPSPFFLHNWPLIMGTFMSRITEDLCNSARNRWIVSGTFPALRVFLYVFCTSRADTPLRYTS